MSDSLRPPWQEFTNIRRGSIGWRMGEGEDYLYRWREWFDTLKESEIEAYAQLYPEPDEWHGFYSFEMSQRRPKAR
jgi:hypothetical protein